MKIKKILIANRAEIAMRVISTCEEKGIETISLYTSKEMGMPHTLFSTKAICLGDGPLSETYLNQDLLIKIAKEENVDAIHPGYGFLSENEEFAKKVTTSGLIFIGPKPEHIKLMGDKKASKDYVASINGPMIPGYNGDKQDVVTLLEEAKKIGFPVLIKASAGGGGKGMRAVYKEEDFKSELEGAKREALNAFSNDVVLLEKYIINPRHIEVQVISDSHGNHLHLFERECSIQRRYQKIVEETPSTALDKDLRERITTAAVEIASGINYLGAGTVEFILDPDNNFYFLEMNTRLQVEHPITEMVTGLDLVDLQIMVASGESLPFKQSEAVQNGHSIEVRIYAEDPDNDFLPTIGKIEHIGKATSPGVRLDTGFCDQNEVTIDFDPMLAKLVVHGPTRDQAILKMIKALKEVSFLGVKTNREFLIRVLKNDEFKKGITHTNFIETLADKLTATTLSETELALAIGLHLTSFEQSENELNINKTQSAWDTLGNFRV